MCSVLHILSTLSCPYDLCAAFLLKAVYFFCVLSRNNKEFFSLKKELWELLDVSVWSFFFEMSKMIEKPNRYTHGCGNVSIPLFILTLALKFWCDMIWLFIDQK